MSDRKPPDNLGFPFGNFGDEDDDDDDGGRGPEDPMFQEEREVRASIKELYAKMAGDSSAGITNKDLFKYLRIVNFNFAALSKLMHGIYFRQGILEEGIFEIHKKLNALIEADELVEDALQAKRDEKSG